MASADAVHMTLRPTIYSPMVETPRTQEEYERSPQRALWRTAKELKMDNYKHVDAYELVLRSSVDQKKYKIFKTLWAFKIKFGEERVFLKLNPRWCVRAGSMDRGMYKA